MHILCELYNGYVLLSLFDGLKITFFDADVLWNILCSIEEKHGYGVSIRPTCYNTGPNLWASHKFPAVNILS